MGTKDWISDLSIKVRERGLSKECRSNHGEAEGGRGRKILIANEDKNFLHAA
jgi:hypothetical protein